MTTDHEWAAGPAGTAPRAQHRGQPRVRPVAWIGGILAAVLAAAVAVTTSAAPASAAAGVDGPPSVDYPHCVRFASGYAGQNTVCYQSLRIAISMATGGRVTDAPETGAEFLNRGVADAAMAKINAAGTAAKQAGGVNRFLAGVVFLGADYSGYSYSMSTTVAFATSAGSRQPCQDENKAGDFSVTGIAPRSLLTFNGCYYDTNGIEWYADDRIPYVNAPVVPSTEEAGNSGENYVRFVGGPTRKWLLQYCSATCTFTFENNGVPSSRYRAYTSQDGMSNCSNSTGTFGLSWESSVGGSIDVGVEVGVSVSGGIPGALAVEASMSASFNKSWNWSKTVTKSVSVDVSPGNWARLDVRPMILDYQGSYRIDFTGYAQPYGRKIWDIRNVTVSQPASSSATEYRLVGGPIAGSTYTCDYGADARSTTGMRVVR
jgi:hypothetical protein